MGRQILIVLVGIMLLNVNSEVYGSSDIIKAASIENLLELLQKAETLEKDKSYSKALEVYNQALKLASEKGLIEDRGYIYKKIGYIYYKQKQYNKAKGYYKKSIVKDSISQNAADTYFYLAILARKQKQQDSLILFLNYSLNIYHNLPESKLKFNTYSKAGIIYKNLGHYDKAINYLIKAYEGFEKLKIPNKKATVCNTIGATQRLLGNLDIAIQYYKEGLYIRKELQIPAAISNSHNNLANAYKEQKQYDSAVYHYKKAIELQKGVEQKRELGRMLNNLASVYYLKGAKNQASKYYNQALQFKKAQKDTLSMVYSLNELALIAIEKRELPKAKKYLDSCNTHLHPTYNKDAALRNLEVNKLYNLSIGNYQKALEFSEKHHALYTLLFNERQSQTIQRLQEQFESKLKQQQIEKLTKSNLSKAQTIDVQKDELKKKNLLLVIAGLILAMVFGVYFYMRQRQKIKEKEQHFKKLEAVFKGQELIKQNISKDLHDIITTSYDGIRLKILALSKVKKPKEISENIIDEIKDVNDQIRLISHRLSPLGDKIKETSLREIIISQLSEFQHYRKIFVKVQSPLPKELDTMDLEAQTNFYGILLEILNNIDKHSEATRIEITHKITENNHLVFNISDNGIGFNENEKKGIGLLHMQQRAILLKGKCKVESSEKGTSVNVEFPINQKK